MPILCNQPQPCHKHNIHNVAAYTSCRSCWPLHASCCVLAGHCMHVSVPYFLPHVLRSSTSPGHTRLIERPTHKVQSTGSQPAMMYRCTVCTQTITYKPFAQQLGTSCMSHPAQHSVHPAEQLLHAGVDSHGKPDSPAPARLITHPRTIKQNPRLESLQPCLQCGALPPQSTLGHRNTAAEHWVP